MTRDVLPGTSEPRGLRRRRRTDVARSPVEAVEVVEAPAVTPSDSGPGERFRAQAVLLRAALQQAEELQASLAHERQLRREEIKRLEAENALLRDTLAALNADAIRRQQEDAASAEVLVPEQRAEADVRPSRRRRRSRRPEGPV